MRLEGTTFTYESNLVCQHGIAEQIEILCFALEGRPACDDGPRPGSDSDNTGGPERRGLPAPHQTQSFGSLSKRAPYYCQPDPALSCNNIKVAGSDGLCFSDYARLQDEAYGESPGVYCRKSCSDSMKEECFAAQCEYFRSECRNNPGNPAPCGYALSRCRDPVTMNKDLCNNSMFTHEIGQKRKTTGEGFERPPSCDSCVSYSGTLCTLDRAAFSQYQQSLEGNNWDTRTLAYNGKPGGLGPKN